MKGKVIGIVCVLLILAAILFGKAYTNGFTQTQTTNPMSQFESISELQGSVPFKFQIPTVVAQEENVRLFNYLNNMIEIQSDKITFRAAPFVADGADVSGDYSTYSVDKKYMNEDSSILLRYRTDNTVTLLNLTIKDMTYSIKFETALNELDGFGKIDIDITEFKEYTDDNKKDTQTKEIEENEAQSGENEAQSGENEAQSGENEEVEYKLVENADMLVSFMVPKVKSDTKTVANNNQLAVMIEDKVVFTIEYYEDGYNTKEFTGYTLKELSDKYIVRYVVDNTFTKESQQYKDYYTIIENIDTIVRTFKTEN